MKNPVNLESLAMWLKEVQANPEMLRSMNGNAIKHEMAIALDLVNSLGIAASDTPSSMWSVKGEVDPHAGKYDGPRQRLAYGNYTDDELANAVFLCDHRQSLSSIGFLTAAKERIRWLSRKLAKAEAAAHKQPANQAFTKYRVWSWQLDGRLHEIYTELGVEESDVRKYVKTHNDYEVPGRIRTRIAKHKSTRVKPLLVYP